MRVMQWRNASSFWPIRMLSIVFFSLPKFFRGRAGSPLHPIDDA
jgi:hypothetical protein